MEVRARAKGAYSQGINDGTKDCITHIHATELAQLHKYGVHTFRRDRPYARIIQRNRSTIIRWLTSCKIFLLDHCQELWVRDTLQNLKMEVLRSIPIPCLLKASSVVSAMKKKRSMLIKTCRD